MQLSRTWLCVVLFFPALLVSGCSRSPAKQAQGYIEGNYTYIATSVSGTLKQLLVERGTWVKQGQALFVLEEQPESDLYHAAVESLNESVAARNAVSANLAFAKITYQRYKVLVPKDAIERSALDNAQSTYEATVAQLAEANATIANNMASVAKAKWTLEQKTINAPIDALVFDRFYRVGEYTQAGQAVVSLLAADNIKAIFYVNEAVLGGLKLGDKISVQCDGCTHDYSAQISFISPTAEYTPPVIYSTETSYKLVFRIEARFKPADAFHLHPGQPVMVSYHLSSKVTNHHG